MTANFNRYRADPSRAIPGRWSVYDFALGGIARKADGTLAYFNTRKDARDWASRENRRCGKHWEPRPSSQYEPCANCGRTPAVRQFRGGRATNHFLCGPCDRESETSYQCDSCGRLHETLTGAAGCCDDPAVVIRPDVRVVTRTDGSRVSVAVTQENYMGYVGRLVGTDEIVVAYVDNTEATG